MWVWSQAGESKYKGTSFLVSDQFFPLICQSKIQPPPCWRLALPVFSLVWQRFVHLDVVFCDFYRLKSYRSSLSDL